MKKKQKAIKLIVTLVVLVVLVAGYAAMNIFVNDEDENQEEENTSFTVNTVEEDSINKISYTKDGNEIVLMSDENGEWYTPNDENCPVDSYTVGNMKSALKEISSTRKIEPEDVDEEEFGFTDPSKIITFTLTDGTEYTYTLGILNDVVDKYYFRMNEEESVYLIDSTLYNNFDYDLLGIAEVEEFPSLGNQDIANLTMTVDGKTWYFEDAKDAAHKKNEDEVPTCVWKYGTDENKLSKMDTDTSDEFISAVISLSNSECVSYNMTKKEQKKYGLDDPYLTLTVNYTEMESAESDSEDAEDTSEDGTEEENEEVADAKIIDRSYTLYVGDTDEETGEYYVNIKGTKGIYTMNVSKIEALLAAIE